MMTELVRRCCADWHQGKCRLSDSVEGWGCRLMVCLPDIMPRNEHAKGVLFHKVYTYAEKSGVLACPHYRESIIDEVIDNPEKLRELVHLNNLSRADYLSEKFEDSYK